MNSPLFAQVEKECNEIDKILNSKLENLVIMISNKYPQAVINKQAKDIQKIFQLKEELRHKVSELLIKIRE